jgi:hypothetical protein
MSNAVKSPARPGILVPAVEEVPSITEAERAKLRVSLEAASKEIAAGNYDEVTSGSLREEFNDIFYNGLSDEELDAKAKSHPHKS